MADLTDIISSSDPKPIAIDNLSQNERFLRHYQQFTGEPSCSEQLWRVPTSSKQRKGWRDRSRDLLIEIIIKLIR